MAEESPARRLRRTIGVMGTVFSVDVVDVVDDEHSGDERPSSEVIEAVAAIAEWWRWVDVTFSTYLPNSAISRLGRAEVRLADCPDDVGAVLELCAQLRAETDGYFSATAAGVLDPSGLVKGWSVDVASRRLREAGFDRHCLNGGGDVRASGSSASGRPWRVAIADPLRPGRVLAAIDTTGLAIATSGVAERGPHVVDPYTGRRPTAIASATVVGPDLARADAYATAAIAMGSSGESWLAGLPDRAGYEAMTVDADGAVWHSAGWPGVHT
jgi:FAD:protein FMN transferase